MLVRLSRAPVVSIASIRGRATGIRSELALACDMCFASREKAILSQWEVGAGLVPGGGPIARLPRLIGRRRALEVLLGADDIRGDIAELYGYVNRSLPDADLDGFVDALATRIGSFDKQAIADTKRLANVPSLPPDVEIAPEWEALMASVGRPASQQRITRLMEQGFHKPGDAENRLDTMLGNWGAERPRCWETPPEESGLRTQSCSPQSARTHGLLATRTPRRARVRLGVPSGSRARAGIDHRDIRDC